MSRLALVVVAAFAALALAAPWLAPCRPRADVDASLLPPSRRHWLGTDDAGRDIFSQLLVGSRTSLAVGLSAGLAAAAVGVAVGLAAGYAGGALDRALMRLVDFFLALPRLPLLMVLAAHLGAGLGVLVAAFALVAWAYPARVVRAQVLVEKRRPYVLAARLSGAGPAYVLRKHILPGLTPLLLAIALMECSHAVMAEAGLSFLGLGDPTAVSWGSMLHYAFVYPALFLSDAWLWWALPPGLCLTALLTALALLGLSLEDRLDPRLKGVRDVG